MKLAVVNTVSPFISGGAEHIADSLVAKLGEYGHEAALVRVFFLDNPLEAIPRTILAARLMRIPNVERIICLKFPAFYIPHPNKILWILHQYRGAYELWNTDFKSLPLDATGQRIRDIVRSADKEFLLEARKIYTNHEVTAKRLLDWNGILAEPMLCPHGDAGRYHCAGYSDTIVAFGRLTWMKRQHLAVEAMAHTKTDVKLHVAGPSEDIRLTQRIQSFIRQNHLEEKVRFEPWFITEEEKVEALARALAAVCIPFEEDSYGYVTLEAFLSRKPCVTCPDAGGVTTAVRPGLTGYIADPDPRALADAFDQLHSNRALTQRMGENAWQYARDLPAKWDSVIARLTS
jgi:glycosyltransferase involved in cell wall biosynthesis